jgi:hypothetical protein
VRAQALAGRVLRGPSVVDRERAAPLAGPRCRRKALELVGSAGLAHERQELCHGGQERAGRDAAAVLLDHEAERREAQLEAAQGLGQVDRSPAELAGALPRLLGRAAVLDDVAHQGGRAFVRERGPDRVDQVLLFRRDLEIHVCLRTPATSGAGSAAAGRSGRG